MYKLSNIFDYYVLMTLETLANNHVNAAGWPTRPQERFIQRVTDSMAELEYGLSETIFNYLAMVCFGEMRHAMSQCSAYYNNVPFGGGRGESYDVAVGFDPVQMLDAAVTLFRDHLWDSSYGGEKWGHMASFALAYRLKKVSPQFFIDHVIDLVHNRGFAFDKESGLRRADLEANICDGELMTFLTAKTFEENLLVANLPSWAYRKMTTTTRRLVNSYYTLFTQEEMPDVWWGASESWPELHVVDWGTRKVSGLTIQHGALSACADCGKPILVKDAHYYETQYLCRSCYNEDYLQCSYCGKVLHCDLDTKYEIDEGYVCPNCYTRNTVECQMCGTKHLKHNMWWHDDKPVKCYSCYWKSQDTKPHYFKYYSASEEDAVKEEVSYPHDGEEIPF